MTATTADEDVTPEDRRAWLRPAKILAYVWLALVLGYFCWQGFWYSGLYAYLAEWQHDRFDWYVPVATVALPSALFGGLPLLIVKLIERRRRPEPEAPVVEERTAGLRVAERLARWLLGGAIVFAVIALGSIVLILLRLPTDSGVPQELATVAGPQQIRTGLTQFELAESPKRAILFRLRWPGEFVRNSFAQAEAKLANNQKITVFVELSDDEIENFERSGMANSRLGILVKNGMPGTALAYLEHAGLRVAPPYYTLYRSELSARLRYLAVSAQLVVFALVIFLFWLIQRLRIRGIKRRLGTSSGTEPSTA
jgi:hypothetical protein